MLKEQFVNQFLEMMAQQNIPVRIMGENALLLPQGMHEVNIPLGQMFTRFEQSNQPDMAVRQFISAHVEYEKSVRSFVDNTLLTTMQSKFPGCSINSNGFLSVFTQNADLVAKIDTSAVYYEFLNAPNGKAIMEKDAAHYDIQPFLSSSKRLGLTEITQKALTLSGLEQNNEYTERA